MRLSMACSMSRASFSTSYTPPGSASAITLPRPDMEVGLRSAGPSGSRDRVSVNPGHAGDGDARYPEALGRQRQAQTDHTVFRRTVGRQEGAGTSPASEAMFTM